MSPYDIMPSPNPRIPVNLQFFLTDDFHVQKVKRKLVQTQTDELKGDGKVTIVTRKAKGKNGQDTVEYIPEQLYIPKKTGIDAFTQVENDELFNFDREVEPIIQVLVTKTIEQSLLEVEEEVELQRMQKFKEEYLQRFVAKNDSDWKNIVDVESEKIIKLNTDLNSLVNIQIRQEQLARKVCSQHLAHSYLENLETVTLDGLASKARYRNYAYDQFTSNFMDHMTHKIADFLKEEVVAEKETVDIFPTVESRLMHKRKQADERTAERRNAEARLHKYLTGSKKSVYIFWENEAQNKPLVFSCFNSMILDDTFDVVPRSPSLMLRKLR